MTITDDRVRLPSGVELALRRSAGDAAPAHPPYLLVHGLASNARVWDGVTRRLAAAGREAVAVDLRGHGRSGVPDTGYDTATAAADVAALCAELGWVGDRSPVVAGQSWGGNVVLTLAARHASARSIALVDGGWLHLGSRFATFEECWRLLAPPRFDGMRFADLAQRIRAGHSDWPSEGVEGTLANLVELPDGGVRARLDRDHHRSIVHSLWADDPRELYPLVRVPTLLMPASGPPGPLALQAFQRAVPHSTVSWYAGADHDLHAQHPQRVTADLLRLETMTTEGTA
ncbi:MAG TPA: alpha/beta fold hydrolase [Angustibacter sp.]|nr:alpha/beta fold hydrolase [Angustibacter sp.]